MLTVMSIAIGIIIGWTIAITMLENNKKPCNCKDKDPSLKK